MRCLPPRPAQLVPGVSGECSGNSLDGRLPVSPHDPLSSLDLGSNRALLILEKGERREHSPLSSTQYPVEVLWREPGAEFLLHHGLPEKLLQRPVALAEDPDYLGCRKQVAVRLPKIAGQLIEDRPETISEDGPVDRGLFEKDVKSFEALFERPSNSPGARIVGAGQRLAFVVVVGAVDPVGRQRLLDESGPA